MRDGTNELKEKFKLFNKEVGNKWVRGEL